MNNLQKKYNGVIVPMITPLLSDKTVDISGVNNIIDLFLQHKVHPFVIGTTGEAPSLSASQKISLVSAVVDKVEKKALVYAGISSTCISDSIADAKLFAELGVDVLVATLPPYYPMTDQQLINYFTELADAVPLPLIIYNMPATVKISIPLEVIDQLSKHENIVGLKDSERDEQRMLQALELWKDRSDFSYLIGWAAMSSKSVLNGADGIVPSTGNFVPELYQGLYEAALAGRVDEANDIQEQTNQLSALYQKDRILSESIPALKALMAYLGICDKQVMPPMYVMEKEEEARYFDLLSNQLSGIYLKFQSNEAATR